MISFEALVTPRNLNHYFIKKQKTRNPEPYKNLSLEYSKLFRVEFLDHLFQLIGS